MKHTKAKTLGVIGGFGPLATALFLELIVRHTKAKTDQEHLDIILYHMPRTPDRTKYILGESDQNPLPILETYAKKLEAEGADVIAVPCVTFSYFFEPLLQSLRAELIHPIRETVKTLSARGTQKVGIMATSGTLYTNLFQRELEQAGISWMAPSPDSQANIMDMIYAGVKAGIDVPPERLQQEAEHFLAAGCDAVILGCTELSIIRNQGSFDSRYFDVLEILAKSSIQTCGRALTE